MESEHMLKHRILVVSLGNPGAYADTLHSAGHIALSAVQKQLQGIQPPFVSERFAKKATKASSGPTYTLLQSPTLMNVSGPWVAKTWKELLSGKAISPSELGLVIVHDDLEEELGVVKIRRWEKSHRGHNGVKSVNGSMRKADFPGARWARISIGIGRPDSRDQSSVSDYVLRPMTKYQKLVLTEKAGPAVLGQLQQLEEEWCRDITKDPTAKE